MQNLPNPNNFETWQSWASEMQKQVEQELLRLSNQKARLMLVKEQPGKPRNGYPVGAPGDAVVVLGESPLLKVFLEGSWRVI